VDYDFLFFLILFLGFLSLVFFLFLRRLWWAGDRIDIPEQFMEDLAAEVSELMLQESIKGMVHS